MASSNSPAKTEGSIGVKRRKEKENSSKDAAHKSDKKRLLKYEWQQNDSEVTVTFNLGSRQVDNSSISHTKFSDNSCFLQLEDGRSWQCDLYQPVVEEGTHVLVKGNKVILKMVKKVPNIHWPQLEYKKDMDVNQKMEVECPRTKKSIVEVSNIKTDTFEENEHIFTVYVCVKKIKKDTLKVHFKENYFVVIFQTSDPSFLKLHASKTQDTFFSWKASTKESIKPEECRYTLTSTRLEINLRKSVPSYWEGRESSAMLTEGAEGSFGVSSWLHRKGSKEIEDSLNKSENLNCLISTSDHVDNRLESNNERGMSENKELDVQIPDKENSIIEVSNVKCDWFERSADHFTLQVFVKNIRKETLKVQFKENCFIVIFQTGDPKFYSHYPSATSETFFSWKANLKESIKPEECKYKMTPTCLEITLKKNVPKYWEGLESTLTAEGSFAMSSWLHGKNSRVNEDSLSKSENLNRLISSHDSADNRLEPNNERGMNENKEMDVEIPEKENSVIEMSHIKYDWFERSLDHFTLQVFVKNIRKETLKVQFKENYFVLMFQTGDPKFYTQYPSATSETFFSWKANLKESIKPEECKYKVTPACLEITLKKNVPKSWGGLEASLSSGATVPTNTWVLIKTGNTSLGAKMQPSSSPSPSRGPRDNRESEMAAAATGMLHSSGSNKDDVDVRGSKVTRNALSTEQPLSAVQAMLENRKELCKKPTCMVSPLNKGKQHEQIVTPGLTGLDNLGNTCFMNSVLQCLANTREFRDYFFEGFYQQEINKDNPLGMGGNMAVAFAVLLRVLWSGTHRSYAPSKLKTLTSMKAPQFSGFAQHDAQEFMAFFLDGLHEDLNRIIEKPYTQSIDSDGRPDVIVAEESWKLYKRRNDSIVVDLFQGQYKSKLVCPVCSKVSITFDPFLYLSVPLPKKQHVLPVFFFSKDPYKRPVKYLIKLPVEATVEELKEKIFILTKVRPNNLRIFEVYNGKIHKFFKKDASLSDVSPNDLIFVFEVIDQQLAGGKVLELAVIQRVIMPKPVTKCSFCKRDCTPGEKKLRRCTKCFRVGYCDQNCQKNHWQTHKNQCRLEPEPVGCPFILSIPESQVTYSKLCRLMEAYSRYSVDVFQPPVQPGDITRRSNSICSSSSSVSSVADVADIQSVDSALGTSQFSSSVSLSESVFSLENNAEEKAQEHAASKHDENEGDFAPSSSSSSTCCEEGSAATHRARHGNPDSNIASEMGIHGGKGCAETGSCAAEQTEKSSRQIDAKSDGESLDSFPSSEDMSQPTFPASQKPAVNLVYGQPQHEAKERSPALFHIRRVTENGQPLSGAEKEYIEDKGDKPLDLYNCYYLAMEWKNNEKMKNYVLVQSKELEYDCNDTEEDLMKHGANEISLSQCLQLFTEPEVLNKQEAWYCPRCKEHREATKQLSLWRLPLILIIQLKRFSFKNLIWRDKIDKMVDFPIRGLDLSKFFCGPWDPPGVPPIYDLFAVINHHGSILGGHYTSFARCVDLQNTRRSEVDWRLFDDSRVSFVPETSVVTKAAYMLFYRRRGVPFSLPPRLPPAGTDAPLTASEQRSRSSAANYDSGDLMSGEGESSIGNTAVVDSNILAYEGEAEGDEVDEDDLNTPPSLTDMDSVD